MNKNLTTMKKILILVFFLSFTLAGLAQNKPGQIIGNWKYSVDAGGMYLTGVFHFFEKEGKLTGEILSDDGYTIPMTKIEQKEPNKFYLEAATDYDTYKITLNFEGDKFSGTGTSYDGDAPITGERKK